MGYVLYHIPSKQKIRWFKTERGAKISRAASNRNAKADAYEVMEESEFENLYNPMVTVKNLLTGQDVKIRAQDVGSCVDPSTERYHCM